MKLTVLQESLSKALSLTSRFSNPRAQLPVLGNILFSAKGNKLILASTNLETSVVYSVGAKVEKKGKITIPAKIISELVSNLNEGQIKLTSEKEQLKIATQGFTSTISGMNASDFPEVPSQMDKAAGSLPMEPFLNALSCVVFAASNDETRPILTGVLFIFKDKELILVATDGFRLSQKKIKVDGFKADLKEKRIILPKSSLTELSRFSKEQETFFLSYQKENNQVIFGFPDIIFSTRTLEGEFPNFEKIVPKISKIKLRIDKEELLKAVKLAAVFARDSANIVKIKVKEKEIVLSAESSRGGSQETKVDARVESEEKLGKDGFQIAFNYRFLEEFLHSMEGEEVEMKLSEQTAPCVFTDPKDPSFLHLIMPVRIQN